MVGTEYFSQANWWFPGFSTESGLETRSSLELPLCSYKCCDSCQCLILVIHYFHFVMPVCVCMYVCVCTHPCTSCLIVKGPQRTLLSAQRAGVPPTPVSSASKSQDEALTLDLEKNVWLVTAYFRFRSHDRAPHSRQWRQVKRLRL